VWHVSCGDYLLAFTQVIAMGGDKKKALNAKFDSDNGLDDLRC
jgi:hypothetical protein